MYKVSRPYVQLMFVTVLYTLRLFVAYCHGDGSGGAIVVHNTIY